MSKKDFKRGVEAAISANTAFMHKQAEATAELGKRIVQKIDAQGQIIDVILDTLNAQEKKELYDLQSEYDIADLGQNEKEVLASYLLTLISERGQDTENQKEYYFAVKKHLGVTDVSPELDLALVENVDSRAELKAMLQTVCEFLFLKTGDDSFLEQFDEEISYFGLNQKVICQIVEPIKKIYDILGVRGIVEHYIPVEGEKEEETPKDTRLVLDWTADREFCLKNGVEEKEYQGLILNVHRDCIVRNFKKITIKEASLVDCIFENCENLTIDESFVTNCTFRKIGYYYWTDVKAENSHFEDSQYDEEDEGLFCLEDVTIKSSTFDRFTMKNDAYMFEAFGLCDIVDSNFRNIRTDRADLELCSYEVTSGKIFKTTTQWALLDEKTCHGLDMINVITLDDIVGDVFEESVPEQPFDMTIEQIIRFSGRDPSVSGAIRSGTIRKGEIVDVYKKSGEIISATVTAIHNKCCWVDKLSAEDVSFSTSISLKINTKGKRLAKGDVIKTKSDT